MASRRILWSILRSSSCRSSSKCPALSTPSLSSTRGCGASAYGYMLNRTSEYATSVKPPPSESPIYDGNNVGGRATVDEFQGKGSAGEVCRLKGNIVDLRFEEGLPEIGTALKLLDDDGSIPAAGDLEVVDHLNESIVRAYSVDGTKGLVVGQRALSTGSPISQPTRKVELAYLSDGDEVYLDEMEQELEDFEQEDVVEQQEDLVQDLKQVYVKARKYLLERNYKSYELPRTVKVLHWTLLNGSVGLVRRLAGRVVDVGFDRKFRLGTTYLEVLPATLEVLPESPLLMQVCSVMCISGDEIMVRAVAMNGTEGLVVGEKVFGFPTRTPLYEDEVEVEETLNKMPELKEFEMEVASFQKKIRLMKQRRNEAEHRVKTELVADGEIVQSSPERQGRVEPQQHQRFSRRPRCHDRIRHIHLKESDTFEF